MPKAAFVEDAEFATNLEVGYYAAFEIMTFCERHGHPITLSRDRLTYDRSAAPRGLSKTINQHREHIKLFIMNDGAPPPGVVLLSSDPSTARARAYAKSKA